MEFEQVIEAAGGLTAFEDASATGDHLTGYAYMEGSKRRGIIVVVSLPGALKVPPTVPYMERLAEDQKRQRAEARAAATEAESGP